MTVGKSKFRWGAALLLSLGVAHALWPLQVALDWPSVSMIVAGLLLLFSREMLTLLPYIKRIKVGGAELELQREMKDLTEKVDILEDESPTAPPATLPQGTVLESTILDLASRDKAAAVARLGIEIEAEMVSLCREAGIVLERSSWRDLTNALVKSEIIGPPLAKALIEFRDVRNKVVHSGFHGPVRDVLLERTLINGLQLLRLLRSSEGQVART